MLTARFACGLWQWASLYGCLTIASTKEAFGASEEKSVSVTRGKGKQVGEGRGRGTIQSPPLASARLHPCRLHP